MGRKSCSIVKLFLGYNISVPNIGIFKLAGRLMALKENVVFNSIKNRSIQF
jgi:hypothetical protein